MRDLDDFSHVWVIFIFHKQKYRTSKPLVNPPRLGGNKSIGVFATRSPNRPNPVGMSAVVLESIEHTRSEILVHTSGGDFLDGTPVIDIKPYVPHIDSISDATSTWANSPDTMLPVAWSKNALQSFESLSVNSDSTYLMRLIDETIAQDPRPAYERKKDGTAGQQWHMKIADFDISWRVYNGAAEITDFKKVAC